MDKGSIFLLIPTSQRSPVKVQ